MSETTPAQRLNEFIVRYSPEVQAIANDALALMNKRLPGCWQLVYDGYNALAIGFSPTEKTSDGVFSIALYPRWVTLFFLKGASLEDPGKLLHGNGTTVRSIVLKSADDITTEGVEALIVQSLTQNDWTTDTKNEGKLLIKSISAKQRPRRPKDGT